jgi:hypothetical protein
VVRQISDKVLVARRLCRRNNLLNERKGVSSSPLICHRFLVFKRCITLNFNVFFPQQQHFFGGGANEVMTLSLRGGFIAEAISLRGDCFSPYQNQSLAYKLLFVASIHSEKAFGVQKQKCHIVRKKSFSGKNL